MHWINKSNYEVSGLGTIVLGENGIFHVKSAMLLPQKNGATHTDIEPEDVGKLMYAMRQEPGDLRFWWHSHVDFDVFWSGTDMATIKKIGAGGWFLSSVFNKAQEVRSAFYAVHGMQTPWGEEPLFIDELTTTILPFMDAQTEIWDAEYTKNVSNFVPAWVGTMRAGSPYHDWVGNGSLLDLHTRDKRPAGISKRKWKKRRKEAQKPPSTLPIVSPSQVDAYGFTQEERSFFAELGWSDHDLDELFDYDVTPKEMLEIACSSGEPDEVVEMLERGWTINDVIKHLQIADDKPVMDSSNGGKYDS